MKALQQPDRASPPANGMRLCAAPVAAIETFGDAYQAAVINAQRLNECSIRHAGLVQYEQALEEIK